jgi:hypothetical protein
MTLSASIACYLVASHCKLTVRFNDNHHLIAIVYQATAVGAFQIALGGVNQMQDFLATISKLNPRELAEYLVSSSSFAVSMSTHHARSVDSHRCCVCGCSGGDGVQLCMHCYACSGYSPAKKRQQHARTIEQITIRLGISKCHELICWKYFFYNPVMTPAKGCRAARALDMSGTIGNGMIYIAHRGDGDRGLYAGRDLPAFSLATMYGGVLRHLLRTLRRRTLPVVEGNEPGPDGGDEGDYEDKDSHTRHIPGNANVALDGSPFAKHFPGVIPESELDGARCRVGTPLFPDCEDEDLRYLIMHSGAGYMARTVTAGCSSCPQANVHLINLDHHHPGIGVGYDSVLALKLGQSAIKKDQEIICKYEAWANMRMYPCTDPSHYVSGATIVQLAQFYGTSNNSSIGVCLYRRRDRTRRVEMNRIGDEQELATNPFN